jgi:uncharacterized membrane protein HdeD (DUF308 family)
MDQDDSSRPAIVSLAVMLLYSSLGIGVLISILQYRQVAQKTSIGFVLFICSAVFTVMWFFIHKISKGRNWARVVFVVLFVLGIPLWVGPMMDAFATNSIIGMLIITQALIQFIAIAILIQKSSSEWFHHA